MSAILIAAIAVGALILTGAGYLWLVRPSSSTRYLAYQEACRAAARDYRPDSKPKRDIDWR